MKCQNSSLTQASENRFMVMNSCKQRISLSAHKKKRDGQNLTFSLMTSLTLSISALSGEIKQASSASRIFLWKRQITEIFVRNDIWEMLTPHSCLILQWISTLAYEIAGHTVQFVLTCWMYYTSTKFDKLKVYSPLLSGVPLQIDWYNR